ncbi:CopM family metallochaperone [Lichenibacterium dinghuense]|uniref:CopM family metallochaperone n=1 Tax=Lichenibacterium dinghuense TaxID=2895977 RepID=UPI001F2384E0|nr:DUF305 domain-containing protein [Lichenibacterium sp. 6Y81]
MTRTTVLAVAILCGSAGAARAAEPMAMDHGAMKPAAAAPPAGAQTPAGKAYAAANDAMMRNMDVKPSGDADRDFAAMMLPHHQGAIDMAKVELRYGRDPVLRRLAADIVAAQEKEIAEMRGWQEKHAGSR